MASSAASTNGWQGGTAFPAFPGFPGQGTVPGRQWWPWLREEEKRWRNSKEDDNVVVGDMELFVEDG